MDSGTLKGFFLAIVAGILWAVSGTVGQFLFQERGMSVEWLIIMRLLIAGSGMLLFAGLTGSGDVFSIWHSRKDSIQLLTFSITGMLAVQYTYFAAISHSNAATATVLQYSGPIMIALFLALKYRRFPKSNELVALALAVTGVFLLVTHGDINTLAISKPALLLGLASAVALAVYSLQPLGLLGRHRSPVVIGWGMLCGGLAFCFVKSPWDSEAYWDVQTYLFTGVVVVFGTLLPFYFYLTAVKIIGAQKASLLASTEPLAATLLAVYWLDVPFLLIDWVGSLCIISTVGLLAKK